MRFGNKKGDLIMSLILLLQHSSGVILAGDSRLSYIDDPCRHTDHTYKIFCYDNRIGIAYHHSADINGTPIDAIMDSYLKQIDKGLNAYDLAIDLKRYFKTLKQDLNTKFHIFGYIGDECKKFNFNLNEDDELYEYTNSCYVTGGKDNVALKIIKNSYTEKMSIDEATIYVTNIFDETEKAEPSVGGKVDMLLISPTQGASWIFRK